MYPYFIIILFFIFTICGVLLSISQEHRLIKTFENNDLLWDNEKIISLSDDFIETLDLTLLNLGYLPSYRGKYQSLLFKNKFLFKRYKQFDILTLNTFDSSYSIKLSKSASSIKNDIFAGKLLKINIKGQNLLFRLPNEMQNIIYRRY